MNYSVVDCTYWHNFRYLLLTHNLALQLSDKQPVTTPVNWNKGDDVIIHPTVNNDEATERFPNHTRHLVIIDALICWNHANILNLALSQNYTNWCLKIAPHDHWHWKLELGIWIDVLEEHVKYYDLVWPKSQLDVLEVWEALLPVKSFISNRVALLSRISQLVDARNWYSLVYLLNRISRQNQ